MSEKNEKPTAKKIKESREQGKVIKSKEITSGVQLTSLFIYLYFYGNDIMVSLSNLIISSINLESQSLGLNLIHLSNHASTVMVNIIGKIILLLTSVTIIIELIQIGPLIAVKAISFKLSRINPIENIKQTLSFKNLVQFIKSIIKIMILSSAFFYIIKQYSTIFQYLPDNTLVSAFTLTPIFIGWLLKVLIVSYIFFGFSDYLLQRHSILKQIKMSKDEVKKENKETEGSPEIKNRRKELQHEIRSGSFESNIKKSTVIIRNPTHIAICLYYHPEQAPIPVVLEKGIDLSATKIISIATNFNIPLVENITLARELYGTVKCGDCIPISLFEAIATLLRCILEIEYENLQS